MKSLIAFTFSFLVFLGTSAFARIVNCDNLNSNDLSSNLKMSVNMNMKAGNAFIYTCSSSISCSQLPETEITDSQSLVLKSASNQQVYQYVALNDDRNRPLVKRSLEITLNSDSTVVVNIDNSKSPLNCY